MMIIIAATILALSLTALFVVKGRKEDPSQLRMPRPHIPTLGVQIICGDLLARLLVEVPTRLNAEQRQKLEEFAALCGEENTPLHKSFFDRAKDFFR